MRLLRGTPETLPWAPSTKRRSSASSLLHLRRPWGSMPVLSPHVARRPRAWTAAGTAGIAAQHQAGKARPWPGATAPPPALTASVSHRRRRQVRPPLRSPPGLTSPWLHEPVWCLRRLCAAAATGSPTVMTANSHASAVSVRWALIRLANSASTPRFAIFPRDRTAQAQAAPHPTTARCTGTTYQAWKKLRLTMPRSGGILRSSLTCSARVPSAWGSWSTPNTTGGPCS